MHFRIPIHSEEKQETPTESSEGPAIAKRSIDHFGTARIKNVSKELTPKMPHRQPGLL